MPHSRISHIGAGFFAALALISTPQIAFAEEPIKATEYLTDSADVIADETKVAAAIEDVPGKDLWVMTVKNLNGMDAEKWAKQSYRKSELQSYDGLVVISVETSEVGYAGNSGSGVTQEILDTALNEAVLNLFNAGKWDDGVILLAENVHTLVDGGSLNSLGLAPMAGIAGGAVVVGGGIWIFSRRKKKQSAAAEATELRKLSEKASSELLSVDDALRSAAAELEFAKAEFGLQATQDFAAALENAKQAIDRGFALRRLLDDPEPETPQEQREMNTEILNLASAANDALAKHQAGFNQLRDLAARVDQKVPELATRVHELKQQLPLVASKIDHLALKYPETMLTALRSYPAQIETLLQAVNDSLAQAKEKLAQSARNEAVPYTKMAEETLSQAAALYTRIDSAPSQLGAAKERFKSNIASLSSDITDADRLGNGNPAIENAKATAQALIKRVKTAENPDYLALNEELQATEAQLDSALQQVRADEEVRTRLSKNVTAAMHSANTAINEADESINRYRAGVNANARTLLARAKEYYTRAENAPLAEQITLYQQAHAAARQSMAAVEQSLSSPHRSQSGVNGDFLAGMIISSVLDGIFDNDHRGGFGGFGGFGGGDFGGGSAGFGGGFGGGRKGF